MGCPTVVTLWQAFSGSIGPGGGQQVQVIGGSSPVPAGASIAFCRPAVKAGSIDDNTSVAATDSSYTEFYSTAWCQVPNLYNETSAFCPISNNSVYLKNFGRVNPITVYLAVMGYA